MRIVRNFPEGKSVRIPRVEGEEPRESGQTVVRAPPGGGSGSFEGRVRFLPAGGRRAA